MPSFSWRLGMFPSNLLSAPINCLLTPLKANIMTDWTVEPNYIYDATQQLAYMHWKMNILRVNLSKMVSSVHTHFETSFMWILRQSLAVLLAALWSLTCVPATFLWWRWAPCFCVSVIVELFLLLLSETLGHKLIHWGTSIMNLLLLTVPPLHSPVLEPDFYLKQQENRNEC